MQLHFGNRFGLLLVFLFRHLFKIKRGFGAYFLGLEANFYLNNYNNKRIGNDWGLRKRICYASGASVTAKTRSLWNWSFDRPEVTP